ncbi:precursor of CEP14 [Herrania umbratica]|uniref:Precursor of CEP14 n=1 Tax=Herrania umbratica TaxID=108875 RepID=A0A6J1APJ6_9ROSI|nr:precursor of CEP14 [Herrania umbratica]
MNRLTLALLILLLALIFQVPSTQSRMLFNAEKKEVFSPKDNLVPVVLPNKPTAPPSPTEKDHIMAKDERLFALHLAKIDRILQSVPSPGRGHH